MGLNPLVHKYSHDQGRLRPAGWVPSDGEYVFVLGDEQHAVYDYRIDDYVEVKQDLDLTSVKFLRVDSRVIQPAMPSARNVAIDSLSAHTATLQRGEVLESWNLRTEAMGTAVNPGSETALKEPYSIAADSVLRVEVDGGGDTDIVFPASPPVMELTAAEVVVIINAALAVAVVNALAQVGPDTADPTVIITSDATGLAATFEVKDYPGPDDDANDQLGFFQKTARPLATDTAIYGGDDLSAILAPDALFTTADLELPLEITGATTDTDNNTVNRIAAVVSPVKAVLRDSITDEPVGFDANILACLWAISIQVGGVEVFSRQVQSGRTVETPDIAANVSKLTGTHEVLFRLQLVTA